MHALRTASTTARDIRPQERVGRRNVSDVAFVHSGIQITDDSVATTTR